MRVLLNKKLKWFWEEPIPWLKPGEIPADPLGQLETKDNELSVFEINDDRNRIERVAAALAIGRRSDIDIVEYILFEQSILDSVGIKLRDDEGGTLDEEVNSWHRNMIELSADKLVAFAKQVVPTVPSDYVTHKRVWEVVLDSCRNGRIDLSKTNLSKDVKAKIFEALK